MIIFPAMRTITLVFEPCFRDAESRFPFNIFSIEKKRMVVSDVFTLLADQVNVCFGIALVTVFHFIKIKGVNDATP